MCACVPVHVASLPRHVVAFFKFVGLDEMQEILKNIFESLTHFQIFIFLLFFIQIYVLIGYELAAGTKVQLRVEQFDTWLPLQACVCVCV